MAKQILIKTLSLSWVLMAACSGTVGGGTGQHRDDAGTDPVDASNDSPDAMADVVSDAADAGADVTVDRDGGPDVAADLGPDTGPVVAQDWLDESKSSRVVVELKPHPDRDRVDLPVIAEVEHGDAFVLADVAVYELVAGESVPVTAAVWTGPLGHHAEVGFEAPGLTVAGASRHFVVYYNTADEPSAWTWDADAWAAHPPIGGGTLGVSGPRCGITREVDEDAQLMRGGRRSGQQTTLRLVGGDRLVAEGFSDGYQLERSTEVFDPVSLDGTPYRASHLEGDGFQAAAALDWELNSPVPHSATLTWRTFRDWPFVQVTLAVDSSAVGLHLSSNAWNARQVYLTEVYDRMVSDVFDDTELISEWDTGMRWLVARQSATGHGFGWLSSHRGVLRADSSEGPTRFFDSYGYSSGGGLRFESLWMAADDSAEVVELFDAMKPGNVVSRPESRDLNILEPSDGSHAFPGDTLTVRVSTPGSSLPVTALWTLPDGSERVVEMGRVGDSWIWEDVSPPLLDDTAAEGRWTLTVTSGSATRQASVEVRLPDHPHLLFSSSDLPELRARKDVSHADIWASMLSAAAGYDDPVDDPGEGRGDIRSYAERLTTLALIQLMDPDAGFDGKLWTYFFKMLRYSNWTDSDNPFNNYDLTVGHFLTALSLTYDWHYDALTAAERAEVRERLATAADAWLGSSWIRAYPDIDWTHYGTVTNNHYWIRHGGIAAVAFVLDGEVDETRRMAWVDRTEANLATVLSVLEDDGASNEGVAYHSYGQINLFPWLDMRDRALGGHSAELIPWFERSIEWDLYSVTPGGDDGYGGPANFGDCPPYHYNPPRTIEAWLAARLQNGTAQWIAENLDWPKTTAMSYLWYDPSVEAESPASLPLWHLAEERGIFAWRSSWADDATYFSIKSGSYFGGHEQPDAGHFILHRAGVPYFTDLGYSYWKMADEHNLVLVDGAGQYGQDHQWMAAVDPEHWASIELALASDTYFDLLADPGPMVNSDRLSSWKREVVGLGPDVFLIRDDLRGLGDVQWTSLLHSYKTDAPTSINRSYGYRDRRLEDPWIEDGAGWILRPRQGAPDLHVADCSAEAWTPVVEPTTYVPEQKLDVGGYNEGLDRFQLGTRLRRQRTDAQTSSLVATWFGDDVSVIPLASFSAEGVRLVRGSDDVAIAVWSLQAQTASVGPVVVTGAMGGVRLDRPAYFGRQLTELRHDGAQLVAASAPISLAARLQHTPTAAEPLEATVDSETSVDLDLACPAHPADVRVDGVSVGFAWSGGTLSLTLPAGRHRIDVEL